MNVYILHSLIKEMRRRLSEPVRDIDESQGQPVLELADWQRGGCLFNILHKLFKLVDQVGPGILSICLQGD
jgi:hypothetical protein